MTAMFRLISFTIICSFCLNGCLLSASREKSESSRIYPFYLKNDEKIPDAINNTDSLIAKYGRPDTSYTENGIQYYEYKRTTTYESAGSFGCVLVSYNRNRIETETTRFKIVNNVVASVSVDVSSSSKSD